MDSLVHASETEFPSRAFFVLLVAVFLGTQLFSYLEVAFILYFTTVLGGAFYVFRHPGEGTWVAFFLMATTCLLYPITVSVLGEADAGEFRPYNFVILSMAGAMVFSVGTHRRVHTGALQKGSPPIKWAFVLVGVFCLATIYGDLSPFMAGGLYVLRQCSAWVSFFLFLWIGYKLALAPADIGRALERFRWAVLIYSIVFLAKFAYVDYQEGLKAATEFAYAQRMALMFTACSLALTFANRLASEGRSRTKGDWLSAVILVPAVVLSGSRGAVGAAIFTMLVLVAAWRGRALLRLTPLLLAAILGAVVIVHSHSQIVEDYVVNRFLIGPDQDASFAGRAAEMAAVIEAVQRNPFLGSGTLASYAFFDPLFGWRETAFVDNGLGYLLLKIGLLGTSVFALFMIALLRLLSRLRKVVGAYALAPMVILLFYLCFLPFGAAFFDLRFSWLLGIVCGHSLWLGRVVKGAEPSGRSRALVRTQAPA